MSHQSPPSSAGRGPASSPFAGTDPTLYSPQLARDSKHRRNDSSLTVIGNGQYGIVFQKLEGLPRPEAYREGNFINEISEGDPTFISRFQFVAALPDGTYSGRNAAHEKECVEYIMKLYACFSTCIPVYKKGTGMYLRFDNLSDSTEANDILQQHGYIMAFVTGYQFALAKAQDTMLINEFEAQIRLPIMIQPGPVPEAWNVQALNVAAMTNSLWLMCRVFGDVRNCVHVESDDTSNVLVFRVEFQSIDAANRAVHSLTADPIVSTFTAAYKYVTLTPSRWAGDRPTHSPHRTKPRVDDQGRLVGYRPAVINTLDSNDKVTRHPSDQHNRVRIERIRSGNDVRTTVMLRNIPNKMDWFTLKAILDDTCFGTYDFIYLRIDFATANNVGYAFVNFTDVNGMIALVEKIEFRSWYGFHSDKAAELSYATIQGREALISKFRNSSVMHQTPFCRPRLFMSYNDPEAMKNLRSVGTERPFVRPDNLSKLQRSMDSSQGLFSPTRNFPSMVDHRNRMSLFDRGTPQDMRQATASQTASQHGPPGVWTNAFKRAVESWYSTHFGQGSNGSFIPFHCIPMSAIQTFCGTQQNAVPSSSTNVGIIGRPAYDAALGYGHHANLINRLAHYPMVHTRTNGPIDDFRVDDSEAPPMPAHLSDHPLL